MPLGRLSAGVVKLEVVVRAVEVLGLAAYHFAPSFELFGQAVQENKLCSPVNAWGVSYVFSSSKEGFGEGAVQHIVAQVAGNRHQLQPGHGLANSQRGLV